MASETQRSSSPSTSANAPPCERSPDLDWLDLCLELLKQADSRLKQEHAWLCEHEEEIRGLIEVEIGCRWKWQQAKRFYQHLLDWGGEVAWFTQPDAGVVTFRQVCEMAGAEADVARTMREPFFRLPFSARRLYDVLEGMRCASQGSKQR